MNPQVELKKKLPEEVCLAYSKALLKKIHQSNQITSSDCKIYKCVQRIKLEQSAQW